MLKIGGIYKAIFFDEYDHPIAPKENTVRIIGLDEKEVFYDSLWSDGTWTFSGNFKRKCSYYRMSYEYFLSKATKCDFKELTEEEKEFFRPDLPMRFGRSNQVDWQKIANDGVDCLSSDYLKRQINTDKIILIPFGPKGGLKKGVLVEGNDKLTLSEIVTVAIEVHKSTEGQENRGIGFFRFGSEKALPSYYIGEYLDKAGFLKE